MEYPTIWARNKNSAYVIIDLDRVKTPIIDLTNPLERIKYLGDASKSPTVEILKANKNARTIKEVLIEGPIPPEAILGGPIFPK